MAVRTDIGRIVMTLMVRDVWDAGAVKTIRHRVYPCTASSPWDPSSTCADCRPLFASRAPQCLKASIRYRRSKTDLCRATLRSVMPCCVRKSRL